MKNQYLDYRRERGEREDENINITEKVKREILEKYLNKAVGDDGFTVLGMLGMLG